MPERTVSPLTDAGNQVVLDCLGDPVVVADGTNHIIYANPALERLLGWTARDLVGQPLTVIMPERFRHKHEAGFRHYMSTRQPRIMGKPIRVPALHKTGLEIDIELTLSPLRAGEDGMLIIATIRDLRERVELERQLASQRKILAQYRAMAVMSESSSFEQAIPAILRATAEALGWDLGIYWARNPSSGRLHTAATWSTSPELADQFMSACRDLTFAPGQGLPGLVLESSQPVWSRDVSGDDRYLRGHAATEHGLRSALLFPVFCSSQIFGVLEYLTRNLEEPDEDLLQTMAALGFQIGQFFERLKSEEQLRASFDRETTARAHAEDTKERLRLTVAAAEMGTWDYNPQSGAVLCDARYKALFGLAAEREVTAELLAGAILPSDRDRVTEAVQRSFEPGSGGDYAVEYRTRGIDDGIERWVAVRGRTFFDEQGKPIRFLGTGADVSDQKRSVERLRLVSDASRVLSSSLDCFSTLPQVVALMVPTLADWSLVEVLNEQGEIDRLGQAHVDPAMLAVASELRRLYPPHLHAVAGLANVIRTGRPLLAPEVTDAHLQGEARDEHHLALLRRLQLQSAMMVPLVVRERCIGAIGFFHTTSGRRYTPGDLAFAEEVARAVAFALENARLYREAQLAVQRRDDLLSIASHELKTPVTALSLYMQAFVRDAQRGDATSLLDPARLLTRVQKGSAQIDRLGRLIEDLLNVSRIAAGHLQLDRQETDLAQIARRVVAQFQDQARASTAHLSLTAPQPVRGLWDPDRIEQIVANLVSNALKYAPGAPVAVEVATSQGQARLTVRDQGPGIAKADQQRIFERFERTAEARNIGGFGLGLWIVRELVQAHGGVVAVHSALEQGASFVVELPLPGDHERTPDSFGG